MSASEIAEGQATLRPGPASPMNPPSVHCGCSPFPSSVVPRGQALIHFLSAGLSLSVCFPRNVCFNRYKYNLPEPTAHVLNNPLTIFYRRRNRS